MATILGSPTEQSTPGSSSAFAASDETTGDVLPPSAPSNKVSRYPWWFYLTVSVAGTAVGIGLFIVLKLGDGTVVTQDQTGQAVHDTDNSSSRVPPPQVALAGDVVATPSAKRPAAGLGQSADARIANPTAAMARDGAVLADAAQPAGAAADAGQVSPAVGSPAVGVDASAVTPDAESSDEVGAPRAEARPPTREERYRRYVRLGLSLIHAHEYEASRQALTRALKLQDDHLVRWLLARSHSEAGQYWAAVYHMKKSLAEAPQRLKAKRLDALGQLYVKLGKPAAACLQFSAALEINPRHRRAKRHHERYCRAK